MTVHKQYHSNISILLDKELRRSFTTDIIKPEEMLCKAFSICFMRLALLFPFMSPSPPHKASLRKWKVMRPFDPVAFMKTKFESQRKSEAGLLCKFRPLSVSVGKAGATSSLHIRSRVLNRMCRW